jgi:branched-chain amino acid transport system ATP-binding protein
VAEARVMGTSLLQVTGLSKSFAGIKAVEDVSFSVEAGSVTALIGPNGSGKSTTIDCISGFTKANAGRVTLAGRDITGASAHTVASSGLVRTFQNVRVYERFSLRDNLRIAAGGAAATNPLTFARVREKVPSSEVLDEHLERVGLQRYREAPAAILSYGQRKLLALAATLILNPAIIILDEPLAGVNPSVIRDLSRLLDALKSERRTFVIIEHNIPFVMRHADHVVVLEAGRKLMEGPPAAVRADERVILAYLGGSGSDVATEKVQ